MTKDTLKRAVQACEASEAVSEKAERALRDRRRDLERAADERIAVELRPEREAAEAARKATYAAKAQLDALKVEYALAHGAEGPEPAVDTVLVEWRSAGYYGGGLRKTGRKGIVSVWAPDSEHPENIRWGLPQVGGRYIRVLKGDGTRSKQFDTLDSRWLPEGEEPGRRAS